MCIRDRLQGLAHGVAGQVAQQVVQDDHDQDQQAAGHDLGTVGGDHGADDQHDGGSGDQRQHADGFLGEFMEEVIDHKAQCDEMCIRDREKILRKAAEMGYKQFAYLPLFQEDAAKAAEHSILPSDKREIAMLTTQFLSSSHFSSMMLDRFQSEIDHLHSGMTIHRISPIELKEKKLPSSLNIQRTAGIICFEVFDYDYAQMLCDLDLPLLFVDVYKRQALLSSCSRIPLRCR